MSECNLPHVGHKVERLKAENLRLRAGIEKLRDDCTNGWVDVDGYPHSPQPAVARRLTKILEGDFQEQLDRARVKYRGALDELRDK